MSDHTPSVPTHFASRRVHDGRATDDGLAFDDLRLAMPRVAHNLVRIALIHHAMSEFLNFPVKSNYENISAI
jgi:hypothetical protein